MKFLQRCVEGCVDCYYILVLLDSSPSSRLHMLEVALFRSLRMLLAVLCLRIRYFFLMHHYVVVIIGEWVDTLLSNPGACTY